jgi:hypothetical protein
MRNPWASYKNYVAYWHVVFPKELIKANPAILFHFAEQFSLMAAVYEIAKLETISSSVATWKDSDGKSYAEHLRGVYVQTGQIPFFFHNPVKGSPYSYHVGKTRLCFQTKDGVQEDTISNMATLLKKLKPKIAKRFCLDNAPVKLYGNLIEPSKLDLTSRWETVFLSISLYTDIWLPFVHGNNYDYQLFNSRKFIAGKFLSNETLARCHTPRFNEWLKHLQLIALELGARWEFDGDSNFLNYKPMLSEDGIILDYEPE